MPRPTFEQMAQQHKPSKACSVCGNPATILCDGRIYTMGNGKELRVPDNFCNGDTRSCDASLCRGCAVNTGHVHIKMARGCHFDTRDLCPACSQVRGTQVAAEVQQNTPKS